MIQCVISYQIDRVIIDESHSTEREFAESQTGGKELQPNGGQDVTHGLEALESPFRS